MSWMNCTWSRLFLNRHTLDHGIPANTVSIALFDGSTVR